MDRIDIAGRATKIYSQLSKLSRYGSMGREEQIEEREVLDSIFPDEITGEPLVPSRIQPRTLTLFRYLGNLVQNLHSIGRSES